MKQQRILRFVASEALLGEIDAEVAKRRQHDISGNITRSSFIREIIAEHFANKSIRRAPVALKFRKENNLA